METILKQRNGRKEAMFNVSGASALTMIVLKGALSCLNF